MYWCGLIDIRDYCILKAHKFIFDRLVLYNNNIIMCEVKNHLIFPNYWCLLMKAPATV